MAELKTFVFTDICGSVRLKDEMTGRSVSERDLAFIQSILTPHRERIEARLAEFGGRVVSTAGDGHFLAFDHTVPAALWAVAVQESHRDEPIRTPAGDPVEVRISIHSGVPQTDPADPNNFVGKSVDYASRLNDYATGAQILISRSVMAILDDVGLEGLGLHMHGRRHLKGIGHVEVHELLYGNRRPRPLRQQPKNYNTERQWTVVPTMGFDPVSGGSGGAAVASGPALRQVGNYVLEDLLGSGGMGDVYKARHVQFDRVRAVKVIKPQYVDAGHSDVIRRFYNEIKAVGRLEHRNIVVAIDSSAPADSVHYLVMEYIEGVSLDELVINHGPLPIADACEVIRQAARGLQYIHKNEMVHRDIKPSNLMITLVDADTVQSDSTLTQSADGQRAIVKILDLGLALLATDAHDRLTRLDHKAMGTGMYMPPEQWRTTSVDIRADIYSLGCTLYHLLAGNPPFFESDLRPEKAHEKSAVPVIRSSLQPLPKKLWDVIRKMLEKRPEDRYSTPAEVAAALAPFAEGHSLPALVRSRQSGQPADVAARETKPGGASHVDTKRSRPWFSGDHAVLSRRYLLSRVAPLTLMLVFAGGAAWLVRDAYLDWQRRIEDERLADLARAAQAARDVLSSFAKTAAATASREVDKRFAVLVQEASDPELITILRQLNADREDEDLYEKLQAWIRKLPDEYGKIAESWFIQDVRGIQVARTPKDAPSLLKPYWFRDYFHGLGQDRDETDEDQRDAITPIKHPHLSSVYYSTTTKLLKVAFSVPIWDQAPTTGNETQASSERKVIGVLAMSINLQDFTVLEPEQAAGSEVVLIDLRKDWIKGENHGLILHHPRLEKGVLARVDGELLRRIDAAKPLTDLEFNGATHFLKGYPDPLQTNPDRLYWGALEPVRYEMRVLESDEDVSERFGWVVLVQEAMPRAAAAEVADNSAK